ncbi:DUF4396 domain-containing protein [Embleya sp. NPDC056575]|uniref:DUF4396 domain-containing protein n=1 Tax=unclassified Embleya TaxID=2699296 RepID=UPI0036A2E053
MTTHHESPAGHQHSDNHHSEHPHGGHGDDGDNHGEHHEHGEHANHGGHEKHHGGHEDDGSHDGHAGHANHASHAGHAGHAPQDPASWKMAAMATLHCLTGCAIGEVLGMIIGTALGWSNLATIITAVVLAFVFGYGLTMRGVLRAGVDLRRAVKVALAADTVSIIVMEVMDNSVMMLVPGAMHAGLGDLLFWASLALSFAVAFVITVPVNRWLIARGKGHAVVHAYH